jgi:ABC-type Fe3+-siderophore transport system permease subunit
MNAVGAFILLLLACGAVMAVFAAGSSQSTTPYVDTFGNTTSGQGNQTQAVITTTAPRLIGGMGIGLILIIAVVVLFLAAIVVWRPHGRAHGHASGRR